MVKEILEIYGFQKVSISKLSHTGVDQLAGWSRYTKKIIHFSFMSDKQKILFLFWFFLQSSRVSTPMAWGFQRELITCLWIRFITLTFLCPLFHKDFGFYKQQIWRLKRRIRRERRSIQGAWQLLWCFSSTVLRRTTVLSTPQRVMGSSNLYLLLTIP